MLTVVYSALLTMIVVNYGYAYCLDTKRISDDDYSKKNKDYYYQAFLYSYRQTIMAFVIHLSGRINGIF